MPEGQHAEDDDTTRPAPRKLRFGKGGRPPLPLGTHGEIRIYRTKGGWRAMTKYRDLDGVVRRVERHGLSKGRAKNRLREALKERRHIASAGMEITGDTRIANLAEAYWQWFIKQDRSTNTRDSYRRRIDQQIIPGIGQLRTREATTRILDGFIDRIENERGPSTAKVTRTVLSGMFGLAVRRDAIAVNPVREVSTITVKHKPARALSLEQAQDLRARIHADPRAIRRDLPDLTDMMLATGERIGETLAVIWDCFAPIDPADCDCLADDCARPDEHKPEECDCVTLECPDPDLHERWSVEIRGTIIRKKGQGLFIQPEPKSEAGFRAVALPAWYTRQLKARKPANAQPGDPVFGGILDPANLRCPSNTANQLRDTFDDAGYTWVTSHVYRKTVATLMDEHGYTARQAADQLGHAHISMTQKHYFGRERVVTEGATVMENVVRPKRSTTTVADPDTDAA